MSKNHCRQWLGEALEIAIASRTTRTLTTISYGKPAGTGKPMRTALQGMIYADILPPEGQAKLNSALQVLDSTP